jgi:hypothetical protein
VHTYTLAEYRMLSYLDGTNEYCYIDDLVCFEIVPFNRLPSRPRRPLRLRLCLRSPTHPCPRLSLPLRSLGLYSILIVLNIGLDWICGSFCCCHFQVFVHCHFVQR